MDYIRGTKKYKKLMGAHFVKGNSKEIVN
jgi:hypothetical protein